MIAGKIKWFNENKGFGFVEPDNGGKDGFLHISVWQAAGFTTPPAEGEAVLFEIGQDRKTKREKIVKIATA